MWPSTSTSISVFPPGRSGSSTTTLIGPSTFVPGVTSISPVSGLISDGISVPSSSVTVTFVVSSGFVTLMPVPCFSSVGFTGLTFELSTDVFFSSGLESLSFGSVPAFFSSSSDTPSPSSSLS